MRRMFDEKEIKELGAEGAVAEIAKGNVENAKPLYYHPINIRSIESGKYGYISMIIIDNNPNAYTKVTFLAKIQNFTRICPLSGAIQNQLTQKILICAYAFKEGDGHYILGLYTDGSYEDTTSIKLQDFVNLETTTFADGVNKLN